MAKAKSFEGKHIVLDADLLNERERIQDNPELFQIYLATGGFGCRSGTIGDKVYAKQIATGKTTQFRRHNVVGLATKKQVKAAEKFREDNPTIYREVSLETIQFDENGEAYMDITHTYRYDVSLIVKKDGVGGIIDMSIDVDDAYTSGFWVPDTLDRIFRPKHDEVDKTLDELGYWMAEQFDDPDDPILEHVWDTMRKVRDLLAVKPTRKEIVRHLKDYARIYLAATLNLETLPPKVRVDLDELPEDVINDLAEKSPRVREFVERGKKKEQS